MSAIDAGMSVLCFLVAHLECFWNTVFTVSLFLSCWISRSGVWSFINTLFSGHAGFEWALCCIKRSFQNHLTAYIAKWEKMHFFLTGDFEGLSVSLFCGMHLCGHLPGAFVGLHNNPPCETSAGFYSCSWLSLIREVYFLCLIKKPPSRTLTAWVLAVKCYFRSEGKSTQILPET